MKQCTGVEEECFIFNLCPGPPLQFSFHRSSNDELLSAWPILIFNFDSNGTVQKGHRDIFEISTVCVKYVVCFITENGLHESGQSLPNVFPKNDNLFPMLAFFNLLSKVVRMYCTYQNETNTTAQTYYSNLFTILIFIIQPWFYLWCTFLWLVQKMFGPMERNNVKNSGSEGLVSIVMDWNYLEKKDTILYVGCWLVVFRMWQEDRA